PFLSRSTCQPHVPRTALHRLDRGLGMPCRSSPDAKSLVASCRARVRLRFRLGRPLRFRKEPAHHVPPTLVFPDGRLGDVLANADRRSVVLGIHGKMRRQRLMQALFDGMLDLLRQLEIAPRAEYE